MVRLSYDEDFPGSTANCFVSDASSFDDVGTRESSCEFVEGFLNDVIGSSKSHDASVFNDCYIICEGHDIEDIMGNQKNCHFVQ